MKSLRNIVLKSALLFIAINAGFAVLSPMETLGRISLYNAALPGRLRLPFGEEPDKAYNLSLFNIPAMFASHMLAGDAKAEDDYRVILLGDSATWGFLLENEDTLSTLLNELQMETPEGKQARFYNLGYPTISLTKDLMLLDEALRYQPDLIVWFTTLEAFPYEKQTFTPLVQHNAQRVRPLIEAYMLNIDLESAGFIEPDWWGRTIPGERRALADLWRLQLYGFAWGATGIDQYIPAEYELRANDLSDEVDYYGLSAGSMNEEAIAFDVLAAGIRHAGATPVLVVNEPIFIADGENSDVRTNFFYPRWAYDEYRTLLYALAKRNGWQYLDAWDLIAPERFTNSAIHMDAAGSAKLAEAIAARLQLLWESTP
jgi:hypothetical protein